MSPADALTAAHLSQSHKQESKDDDARRKQADSDSGRTHELRVSEAAVELERRYCLGCQ